MSKEEPALILTQREIGILIKSISYAYNIKRAFKNVRELAGKFVETRQSDSGEKITRQMIIRAIIQTPYIWEHKEVKKFPTLLEALKKPKKARGRSYGKAVDFERQRYGTGKRKSTRKTRFGRRPGK